MSTLSIHLPRVHTTAPVVVRSARMAAPVEQSASLAFSKSGTVGVDSVASIADVGVDASTTKLSLSMDLKAGQQYSFSFAYNTKTAPTLSLIDANGKSVKVNMAKGFTVKESGTYTLAIDFAYSLKTYASIDQLAIKSKAVLPKSSGDKNIDALLFGATTDWWHDADAAVVSGSDLVSPKAKVLADTASLHHLTYSFLSSVPSGQESMTGFQTMTEEQKAAVRSAFDYYGKLIDVSFDETDGGAGNINFGTNNQASSAGYATPPNTGSDKDKSYLFLANNQWTNAGVQLQEGGYGWETILHEIGHTLGLKHAGNYNAGGGGSPGPYLSKDTDNRQYSIMSYNNNKVSTGVNPKTAMLYDIAALQYLYGVNDTASTAEDGSFTFANGQSYLETLWSTSGTDSIDLTGLQNASRVDLNAGTYSSINITGSESSTVYAGLNNVALAYGSYINSVKLSTKASVAESVALNNAYATGAFNTLTNFEAGADQITLKKSVFKGISAKGIEFGTTATSAATRIVVNNTTGELFYTAKGNKGVATKIAQFSMLDGGSLTGQNFSIVA